MSKILNRIANFLNSGLLKSPNVLIGSSIVFLLILMILTSLFYTPYDPVDMDIVSRLEPPSKAHLFGTDQYGRDIFSRILAGSTNSLLVGIIAVGVGMLFGVVLGSIAAAIGGWWDELTMRAMDMLYSFPPILTAVLITSVFGPSLLNAILAIGIFNIPIFARLTRGNFLSIREEEYVQAAKSIGRGSLGVVRKHVIPNMLSPLIVQGTIQFATAILAAAALSYLGLGKQPPTPSWGLMLKQAQSFMRISPWPAIFPGLAIMLSVLGLNLLGDGLRDILDPKLTHSG